MEAKSHAAIVTGAGSGLGAATATALAFKGARVALLDVNIDGAQKIAKAIGGIAIRCDVTSAKEAEAAVAEAEKQNGIPRILVNCAGIGPAKRIVGKDGPQPLDEFERVIKVNLTGTFNMMRLIAARMQTADPLQDGERGVIISTASVAAFEGQIGQAAYSASKGGVVAMTLPAAREFAQFGIRVLAIAPGIFKTPMVSNMPDEVQQSLANSIPFPKLLGKPEQYSQLVMHMVENRYLNGEVVRLDGAIRMQPK